MFLGLGEELFWGLGEELFNFFVQSQKVLFVLFCTPPHMLIFSTKYKYSCFQKSSSYRQWIETSMKLNSSPNATIPHLFGESHRMCHERYGELNLWLV